MEIIFFEKLPIDIIYYKIKPYLALHQTFLTNKTDYNHYTIEKYTSLDRNKDTSTLNNSTLNKYYITKLIRQDLDFIFGIILDIKFKPWYRPWKIKYKGNSLPCFIELLNYICIENRSTKCKKRIKDKIGNRKKKHKRIRIISNTWSN
jgi:hypothetical protein